MANGWKVEKYSTNDYLYADDINKIIGLLNSFIIFGDDYSFKGIKIPDEGLTLFGPNNTNWLLSVDENGILQTEKK